MLPPETVSALRELGIVNPEQPSQEDVTRAWSAYLKDRKLTSEMLDSFMSNANISHRALMETLKVLSEGETAVAQDTIGIVKEAMEILKESLRRDDLSPEERERTVERVMQLVREAREESGASRSFKGKVAGVALGTLFVGVGIGMLIATKGQNKDVLEKGGKLLRLALK